MISPGPALQEGAVDDQLGRGIQILHRRHVLLKSPGDQGRVGADDAGDGGLRDAVDLGEQLLARVVPQVGQGQAYTQEQPQHPRPEHRQGTGSVNASHRSRTSLREILVLLFVMAVCFLVGLA